MKNLYHWTIPKSSKMHSISQVFSSHPKGTHLGHPTVSLTVASPPGGLSNTSRLKWNIGISELKKRWFFNQNWSLRILRIMIDRSNVLSSFLEWLWKLQSREVFWTFTSCSHAAVQNSLKLWCHFFACFNSLAGKKHKFYQILLNTCAHIMKHDVVGIKTNLAPSPFTLVRLAVPQHQKSPTKPLDVVVLPVVAAIAAILNHVISVLPEAPLARHWLSHRGWK